MKRLRPRYLITGGALLALGLGAFFSYWLRAEPALPVLSAEVSRGDIEKVVLASGILKPAMQVNVGAQVNGQLRKLYVRQGDRVKKGQLLAEIDPTIQQSELRNATAQLASARAQRLAAAATLVQYRQELERQRSMARDGSGIRSELERAQAQYEAQRQQVSVSEAQIVQAEMAVQTAEANLGYTRIMAPDDGEVLGIVTREGQTIVSSQTAPTILILANLERMEVQTRISEADIQKIHPGQPLWFYVIANPQQRYKGVMGYVQPAPQEALDESRSGMPQPGGQQASAVYYNATFEVANRDRQLKTSMTAQVFIRVAEAKNVWRIPAGALGRSLGADRYQVSVLVNGQPQTRVVQTGLGDRHYVEVRHGLKAGERVVLPSDGQQE